MQAFGDASWKMDTFSLQGIKRKKYLSITIEYQYITNDREVIEISYRVFLFTRVSGSMQQFFGYWSGGALPAFGSGVGETVERRE